MRRRMTNEILIYMFMAFLTDVRCIIPTEKQITVTFFHYQESWNRAQAICRALGGDLYREFSEERAIVLRVFRNLPEWFPDLERYAWIGVHALLEADGNLTWVYGMPTCNVIYPSSHIHWNPLDPSYGLQCATQYLVDAQWYTARCDWDFKHFICERTESTDCTFTETTGTPKLTISLDYKTQTSTHSNSASCRDSCLSSMYSGLNCWAATYEGTSCVLYYTSDPWLFTDPVNIDASSKQLFLKDCYISPGGLPNSVSSICHDHSVNSIQLFHITSLCNSLNYQPKMLQMTRWHCCTRPKAEGNSAIGSSIAPRVGVIVLTVAQKGMTDSTDDTPTSAVDSRTPDEGCTHAVTSTAPTTTSTTTTSTTTTTPTTTTTTTPTTTTTTPTTTTTTTPTTTTPTTTTTFTTTTTPTTTSTTTPTSTSTSTTSTTTTSSTTSTSTTSTIPATVTTSTTTATTPTSTSTSTTEQATTSSSTTSSSTSTSKSTTTSQADTNCSCSCADLTAFFRNFSMDPVFANLTTEEKLSIITQRLTLNKSLLSSTIRKKTSAEDNRPSSVSIGVVSIVFMALILGVLLTSDAINFCNQCSRKVGTTL